MDIDDLENDGETIEDIYDGWQQCFFFLENETESDKSFYLTFSYGPTTIVDKKNSDFYPGYAAFTNFETYEMTEKQFSYAATGTYAKSVSLTGEELSSADAGFDSAASIPENAIETGIADPKNYTGVYGGSGYVVAGRHQQRHQRQRIRGTRQQEVCGELPQGDERIRRQDKPLAV